MPILFDLLVVALTMFAPVAGATNLLWAKAVLLVGGGVVIFLSPPQRSLTRWQTIPFIGLAVVGAFAFLPAGWGSDFPWRRAFAEQFHVELPSTVSSQPWLSLESYLLFVGGLTWFYYLLVRSWHLPRRILLSTYAGAIFLITAYATYMYLFDVAHPYRQFGFFPNRNQIANLLALGGIIALALSFEDFANHRWAGLLWLAGFCLPSAGLMLAGSRAGILILAIGSTAWLYWCARLLKRASWIRIGIAGLVFFFAIFYAAGGRTLGRFLPSGNTEGDPDKGSLRLSIQRDAVGLAKDASWHGVGLNNFSAVFARYRHLTVNPDRALHPESDLLWAWTELGFLAPVLMAMLFGLLLARCWPFDRGSERVLRTACFVCVSLFLVHGLVDVSGHRVGTVWPAMLLFALALHTDWGAARSVVTPVVFRALAVVMVGVGMVWLASAANVVAVPTSAELARLKAAADAAIDAKKYSEAIKQSTAALRIAPMDWEVYFSRGRARAFSQAATAPAASDFAVARYLEPNAKVAFGEGVVWLSREPDLLQTNSWFGREPQLALGAWKEALERSPVPPHQLYGSMLYAARNAPEMLEGLRTLAGGDLRRQYLFLEYAHEEEFAGMLKEMLAADPELKMLSDDERRRVILLWSARGDRVLLENMLWRHPTWQKAGWLVLADLMASRQEFDRACELARRYVPQPVLPPPVEEKTLARVRQDYEAHSRDVYASLVYFQMLVKSGEHADALEVLKKLTSMPDTPKEYFALEAQLWYKLGEFEKAWRAWRRSVAG